MILVALSQTFTRGCLTVLTVVVAIRVLHTGDAGVGLLTTAVGAGAVAGSLAAGALSGSHALARWEGVGAALWGLPLLVCAMVAHQPSVLVLMAGIGEGNVLVDVGLYTVPARLLPAPFLGRVYGVFESLVAWTVALGSLTAPAPVSLLGSRGP